MLVQDRYYGDFYVDERLAPLLTTRLGMRAAGITMGTVPNWIMPIAPLPSRQEHNLGAYHLCGLADAEKYVDDHQDLVTKAAAMMHDWGNGPFAHLSEPLLQEHFGHNGESFLEVLLDKFDDAKLILAKIGLTTEEVVATVMGQNGPLSKIVHGTLDVDNLDNLTRAFKSWYGSKAECFSAQDLAASMHYSEGLGWCFRTDHDVAKFFSAIKLWKTVRREVYHIIHTPPHLVAANMLFMALFYAHEAGQVPDDFFFKTDLHAWSHLYRACPAAKTLTKALNDHQFYTSAYFVEVREPSARLAELASDWKYRVDLTERFADYCGIDRQETVVYVGHGNQERRVDLPLVYPDALMMGWDQDVNPELHRILISVHPSHGDRFLKKSRDFAENNIL